MIYIYIYIYIIYILKLCGMLLFWTIVTKATELEEKKNRFFLFLVRVPQEHLSTFPASRFNSRSSRERLGKSFKGNTFCASAAKWKTSVSVRTGPKEQVQKWWIDPSFFAGFSGENVVLSILSHGIWFFFYVQTNRFSRNPIVIWFWKGLGSVGFPGKGCLTLKPRKHKSSVEIPLLPASERPKNRPGQWNGKGAVAINPSWGNEHPQIPAILMWKPRDSMALADPSSCGIGWDTQFHLVFTTLHLDLIATVMGKVLIYQWNWVYAYAIFELIHEVHKAKISQIPPSGGWKSLSWQN